MASAHTTASAHALASAHTAASAHALASAHTTASAHALAHLLPAVGAIICPCALAGINGAAYTGFRWNSGSTCRLKAAGLEGFARLAHGTTFGKVDRHICGLKHIGGIGPHVAGHNCLGTMFYHELSCLYASPARGTSCRVVHSLELHGVRIQEDVGWTPPEAWADWPIQVFLSCRYNDLHVVFSPLDLKVKRRPTRVEALPLLGGDISRLS